VTRTAYGELRSGRVYAPVRRSAPAADRVNMRTIEPLYAWYQSNESLADYVACLAWRHRGQSPMIGPAAV
jgi:hypothetical protein